MDSKDMVRAQWDRCAAGWDAHTPALREWLATATDAMLRMAGVAPGQQVLDVAAGAGDQTLDLAARVGPQGRVLATDLSPEILRRAEAKVRGAGHANVVLRVADAEALGAEAGAFDAAVCRLGLMFLPEPLQGLRQIHRALRPGGRLCTVVFGAPERNPCVTLVLGTALRHAGLPPRDPFAPGGLMSLGRPGHLDELFRAAGFAEVATTALAAPFRLPSARAYLDFLRSSASPVVQMLGRLDATAQQAAWDDIEQRLHAFDAGDGGWVGPNELLLTAGRR